MRQSAVPFLLFAVLGVAPLALCGCQSQIRAVTAARNNCAPPASPPTTAPAGQTTSKTNPISPAAEKRGRFVLRSNGLPDSGWWKCHPLLADLNGDGHLDLAAMSRKAPGLRVWLGASDGMWHESSEGLFGIKSCGGGMDVADLNQDGHLDLAVADHCHGAAVYFGDGKGAWKASQSAPRVPNPARQNDPNTLEFMGTEDIALGDFDKDGFTDLVVGASEDGGIRAFRGAKGGASWTPSSNGLPVLGYANTVLLTDMNGDAMLDIVAAYEEGPRVYAGDGKGNWRDDSRGLPIPQAGGLYHEVAVGDVNEDGRLDIAAANWIDGIEIYLRKEHGGWEKTADVFPELRGGAVGVGLKDITGDGHVDIVATGRKPFSKGTVFGVFALLGNGRGGFELHRGELPETGLSASWCFDFGDVNKDGIADFVVAIGGIVPRDPNVPESLIKSRLQVWCWEPANGKTPRASAQR